MSRLVVALFIAFSAAAQTPTDPPVLIQIIRSVSNGDSMPRRYDNTPVSVLGLRAITGEAETWLLEVHGSFDSIEQLDRMSSAEGRTGDRTMIALYRPVFSYRPDLAIRSFPQARYFHVTVFRVRSGTDADFGEVVHARRAGFDRINLDRPDIAYQVVSGAPAETYLFIAPMSSFKTLDDALQRMSPEAPPKAGNKALADIEVYREHLLLRVDPRISRVPASFTSANPELWGGKSK